MRVVILNRDYPGFLRELYLSRPGLEDASYAEQLAVRNESLFGVADFYSRNFIAHGHQAMEIHLNNPWLQHAWAREHGLVLEPPPPPKLPAVAGNGRSEVFRASLGRRLKTALRPVFAPVARPLLRRLRKTVPASATEELVMAAQIAEFRPDVILNQEMAALRSEALRRVKSNGMLAIGQIASALPENENFAVYDLVISSLPNQVDWFRRQGVRSELNRLAFEPAILEKFGPQPERDIPLSFVGSLSPDHVSRIVFLEHLATRTPLKVWGNGIERLPKSSPLHALYQGQAWGRDMYDVVRRSKITLNFHIDLAEDWANNMRLYEATGMGALLLTDWKKNLHEMFVPGKHVATYTDNDDCVRQIHALLSDNETREHIAAAGQQHAIREQNYFRRAGEILDLAGKLRSGA